MRGTYLCIADTIDVVNMSRHLRKENIQNQVIGEALYLKRKELNQDIIFFANGTVITWNVSKPEISQIIKLADTFVSTPITPIETDYFLFRTDGDTNIRPHDYFNVEILTLENDDTDLKLALSFGFSQSIKLLMYQKKIDKLIDIYSPLIHDLAKSGKIHLTSRSILRIIGDIFTVKSLVNLKGGYSGIPTFFWKYSNLEPYYLLIERYLDLPRRIAIANQKLDTLNEVFDMLNGQLQHRHSSFLEWIIILLIAFEIIFNLLHL